MEVAPDDPLQATKLRLLAALGAGAGGAPALRALPSAAAALAAARALVLRSDEAAAWAPGAGALRGGALAPRNEAAALALLWAHADTALGPRGDAKRAELAQLSADFCARTGGPPPCMRLQLESGGGGGSDGGDGAGAGGAGAAAAVQAWAVERGAATALVPAAFEGGPRGLAAQTPLAAGDVALSLPAALLITYETARESDLGKALARIPGLGDEALAVVWTMVGAAARAPRGSGHLGRCLLLQQVATGLGRADVDNRSPSLPTTRSSATSPRPRRRRSGRRCRSASARVRRAPAGARGLAFVGLRLPDRQTAWRALTPTVPPPYQASARPTRSSACCLASPPRAARRRRARTCARSSGRLAPCLPRCWRRTDNT
jgi:hypothetical protein